MGFIVIYQGLRIDPAKTEAIRNYPRPKTIKQLKRYLGMLSWYRRFLRDFSKRAEPLMKLTRNDQKFKWAEEQDKAFQELNKLLVEAPMLHRPVSGAEYFLHCDACDTGLGSVLTQKVDGLERVIAYASRALTKSERVYSVTEKECLAVKWSIEKFRGY